MASGKTRPNVLWIGADQLRFDSLSQNGNRSCLTPNIDRLAAEGVCFERAYTPCSLCSPARASMFTGRYAFRHGMGTNCDMYHSLSSELSRPEELLHRNFQDAGYRCAFVGKWHVGTDLGPGDYGFEGMSLPGYGNIREDEGFKTYLKERGLSYSPEPERFLNPDRQTLIYGAWGGPQESTPGHYLVEKSRELMEGYRRDGEPFFLTCQFWGPHGPHMPSEEFYGMHDPEQLEPWENYKDDLETKPRRIRRERDDFYRNHPENWKVAAEITARYYDCCAMLDYEVGRLLDYLESSGLAENTVVVFSTDHGDMTASHGGLSDKGLLYEEAQHIPLIFSGAGGTGGAVTGRRDDLASNMDIMPTLMELCGITGPEGLDGISLLPALRDDADRRKREDLLLEFHGLRFLYSQRALISEDGWKYIFSPGDYDELYDLNKDPYEMENLLYLPEALHRAEEMRRRLMRASAESGDPLRDCVSKFFGHWRTGSGQIDATGFFDDAPVPAR